MAIRIDLKALKASIARYLADHPEPFFAAVTLGPGRQEADVAYVPVELLATAPLDADIRQAIQGVLDVGNIPVWYWDVPQDQQMVITFIEGEGIHE